MTTWIKTSEQWPERNREVLVRLPECSAPRTATIYTNALLSHWRLTDCTHPFQNAYWPLDGSEWLDD